MRSIEPEEPLDDEFMKDLLGEVQADWKALAEEASMPPDGLDAQDHGTRAAVSWMQNAWVSIREDDAPPMPLALARAHARVGTGLTPKAATARRRRVLWMAGAIAAVALAIAGAALLPDGSEKAPGPGLDNPTGDRVAAGPKATDQRTPTPVDPMTLEESRAAAPIPTFTPEQFVSRPDGVEIVTGKVRLILLQPNR